MKELYEHLSSHLNSARPTWSTARGAEMEVRRVQRTWVSSQGRGTWGRPLYRTGRLHRLIKKPLVRVRSFAGRWSLKVSVADNSLGGRVALPRMNSRWQFFDHRSMRSILVTHVIPKLSARKSKLGYFSRGL